ncbi:MAG: prolyl oligopeptidase family serine peptidase [Planctomycetaceae bacterium]|jgi:predicted peptidase|nr:prolyl oligopeptidase family serine peptidase [Planctomycetaceae bacterium]
MLKIFELFVCKISAIRESLSSGQLVCAVLDYRIFWCVFFVGFVFTMARLSFLTAEEVATNSAKLPIGIQVVRSVELPASTSDWHYSNRSVSRLGDAQPLEQSKTEVVRYWIYLPHDYEKQEKLNGSPLLLFLHGVGERGNTPEEIDKVKVHGPPNLLDKPEFNKAFPCVTVSPQCKHNYKWSPFQLLLLLDHIEQNYKIDKSRIYITGISMGGYGTWMCLNASPERFAAAAPICGGANPEWAKKLIEIPIWNFHGDNDKAVPFVMSQRIVDAIRKANGKKIIFTSYEGGGHDVWTQTYNNQLLFDWLFSQSR